MMFDYLMAWTKDAKLRSEGVVAFIGADDKAFCSDQSIILSSTDNKKDCNRGNDGVREVKEEGEKKAESKESEKFQDDEENKCFSWENGLGLNGGCGEDGNIKDKAEVGQMYGLSKGDAKGFKKLKESPN